MPLLCWIAQWGTGSIFCCNFFCPFECFNRFLVLCSTTKLVLFSFKRLKWLFRDKRMHRFSLKIYVFFKCCKLQHKMQKCSIQICIKYYPTNLFNSFGIFLLTKRRNIKGKNETIKGERKKRKVVIMGHED